MAWLHELRKVFGHEWSTRCDECVSPPPILSGKFRTDFKDKISIFGYPCVINDDVSEMVTSTESIVFGDFSKYLILAEPPEVLEENPDIEFKEPDRLPKDAITYSTTDIRSESILPPILGKDSDHGYS